MTYDADPIGTDLRRAKRLERLGPGPHLCVFCGLTDPDRLVVKPWGWLARRVPRQVLEEHHVVGRQHDQGLIVLLCVPCHFEVSQGYLQAGIELRPEPDRRRRLAWMLRALAVFFEMLAPRFRVWAGWLDPHSRNKRHGTTNPRTPRSHR